MTRIQLARDATASGDPVAAENYYQHAEHYFRLIAAAQVPAGHPQKAILAGYTKAYEARFKHPVSTFGGYARDAIRLVTPAAKRPPSTEPAALRAALDTRELRDTVHELRREMEERRRAEAQLQLSSTVIDQTADGIAIVDSDGSATAGHRGVAIADEGGAATALDLGVALSLLKRYGYARAYDRGFAIGLGRYKRVFAGDSGFATTSSWQAHAGSHATAIATDGDARVGEFGVAIGSFQAIKHLCADRNFDDRVDAIFT